MKSHLIFSLLLIILPIFSHQITDRVTWIKEQKVFIAEYRNHLEKEREKLERELTTLLEADKITDRIITSKIYELNWEEHCLNSGNTQFNRLSLKAMQTIWDHIPKKSSNCVRTLSSLHPQYHLYRVSSRNLSFISQALAEVISHNLEKPVSMTFTILVLVKKTR